jgi:branched-subunit amino acid ABC-type transport system permease component
VSSYIEAIGFGVIAAASIALGAMGFTLQFGLTNVFNIGYGALMTLGAFVTYFAHETGMSVWAALCLGGLATSVATLLVAKTLLAAYARQGRELFEMAMVTFGVALIVQYTLASATQSRSFALNIADEHAISLGYLHFTDVQLILVLLALGVVVVLDAFLHLTKLGTALRATAIDPDLARACGISTGAVVVTAWLVSGFLCGLAGGVFLIDILTLSAFLATGLLALVFVSAIMGSAGSVRGAVLAALFIGIVTQVVSAAGASAYNTAIAYGILALVLLLRPRALQTLVAQRHQITV